MKTFVWVIDERVIGEVVGPLGTYFTRVRYTSKGNDYDLLLEGDEFYIMEDQVDTGAIDFCGTFKDDVECVPVDCDCHCHYQPDVYHAVACCDGLPYGWVE